MFRPTYAEGSLPSYLTLMADLLSAKTLVWIASVRTSGELTPDAHLYFFDRYRRLAAWHRARNRPARATQLDAAAEEHYRCAGGDGPPYAAAMAMPRPSRYIQTNAVGRRFAGPDDAA